MQSADSHLSRRRFLRLSGLGPSTPDAAPARAACASPGMDDDALRIGALFPVSGSLVLLGEESWRGGKILAEMSNGSGGAAGEGVEVVLVDALTRTSLGSAHKCNIGTQQTFSRRLDEGRR